MDNLVSFIELKKQFNLKEMSFFSLIQKGQLTPYNRDGIRLIRPDRKTKEYLEDLKREKLSQIAKKMAMLTDPPAGNMRTLLKQINPELFSTEYEIEKRIEQIEFEIKKYSGNLDPYDWIGYRLPHNPNSLEELNALMALCYFKFSEIKKIIGLFQTKESESLDTLAKESGLKITRKSQLHRLEVESTAERLWSEDQTLTITDVIKHPEVNKSYDGETYAEKTLHRWASGKCPNPKRGRPKKR